MSSCCRARTSSSSGRSVAVLEVLLSSSSSGWTWWQRLWRTGVPLASVQAARGIEGCEGNQQEEKVQHLFVFVFLFLKKG